MQVGQAWPTIPKKGKGCIMKTCRSCGKSFPIQEFYDRDRELRFCSSCRKREVDRIHAFRESKRALIDQYKIDLGCSVCGFNESARALELHHTDHTTKFKDVAWMITNNRSMDKIWEEVKKCTVLCANHHRMIHAGELIIPV